MIYLFYSINIELLLCLKGHIAYFKVNNTIGSYKSTVEATAGDPVNDTIYFTVSYSWWDKAWGKRKMLNLTNVNTTDFPFAIQLSFGNNVLNCTREVRVVKYDWAGGESQATNTLMNSHVYNETYESDVNNMPFLTYCTDAYVSWNLSASGTNEKQTYFVYYGNPLAEKPDNRANTFYYVWDNWIGPEDISNIYFDSHVDLWWNDTTDFVNKNNRPSANITYNSLVSLGYRTQARGNPPKEDILNQLPKDNIYWFYGHGGIRNYTTHKYNETVFARGVVWSGDSDIVSSTNISSLSQNLNMKLAMVIASFAGDNSTTLPGCNLDNWLSNAFKNKGSDCYLSFLGEGVSTPCSNCNCDSDVKTPFVDQFNTCFWSNITAGKTIKDAVGNATICAKRCGFFQNEDCVNAILVERFSGACNQKLMR